MLNHINQILEFKNNIESLSIKKEEKKRLLDICNEIIDCITVEGEKVNIKEGKTEDLLKSIDHFLKYITLVLNAAMIETSFNQTKK
jgi:hypothetical protein